MTTQQKFSPENIEAQIRARIEKAYGTDHNIKIALFKAVSEYNDEYYNYSPILILIDKDYNEIDNKIHLYDLCPDEEEQYNEDGEEITIDDLTIKF